MPLTDEIINEKGSDSEDFLSKETKDISSFWKEFLFSGWIHLWRVKTFKREVCDGVGNSVDFMTQSLNGEMTKFEFSKIF